MPFIYFLNVLYEQTKPFHIDITLPTCPTFNFNVQLCYPEINRPF